MKSTDIDQRYQNLGILIPAWGWTWGSSGFSRNQNNCGLSGVCVTCMFRSLSVKTNKCKNAAQHAKIINAFVLHLFLSVWSAKTRRPPKLSPMADDAITRGGVEGLVSLVYICGNWGTLLLLKYYPLYILIHFPVLCSQFSWFKILQKAKKIIGTITF